MSMNLKSFFRSFTPYQIGYLIVVVLLTLAFAIFFPELMLEDTSNAFVVGCSVVAVLANPICVLIISNHCKVYLVV